MIPNGKKIDWHGHNLSFESEPSGCRGCLFANKNECPDCDEGIWVEEGYPWHIGIPTEEGEYLIKYRYPQNGLKHDVVQYPAPIWGMHIIEKWQKIADEEANKLSTEKS